ncbi:Hypothetical predicted protein [Octopus vulgaris]|uniref:Uncharacterized protein n=1 Tax=Octopus vulgaris TaxID=6645 RepID=A0AA36BTN9_OCTVU|nr:Hypothetical predicted protein [Octopus vulgaris]
MISDVAAISVRVAAVAIPATVVVVGKAAASIRIDDEQDVESMPDSPIEIKFTSYDQPPMPERAFEEVYYFAK